MDKGKFLLIHLDVLPDVFLKVIEAKDLIKEEKVTSVSEATKLVGISRSTFYKYNDYVFTLSDGVMGKKATISMSLDHQTGILSLALDTVAKFNGNILTISQSTPIDKKANVTITIDISEMTISLTTLMNEIKSINGVYKFTLVALE